MTEPNVTTHEVTGLVEEYVRRELSDYAKYENRSPLDEDGIRSLHQLAARVYSLGFRDGENVERRRGTEARLREREAASK